MARGEVAELLLPLLVLLGLSSSVEVGDNFGFSSALTASGFVTAAAATEAAATVATVVVTVAAAVVVLLLLLLLLQLLLLVVSNVA